MWSPLLRQPQAMLHIWGRRIPEGTIVSNTAHLVVRSLRIRGLKRTQRVYGGEVMLYNDNGRVWGKCIDPKVIQKQFALGKSTRKQQPSPITLTTNSRTPNTDTVVTWYRKLS